MEIKTLQELKLIRKLKGAVNSVEEYEFLCDEEMKILSSHPLFSIQMKGGAQKW